MNVHRIVFAEITSGFHLYSVDTQFLYCELFRDNNLPSKIRWLWRFAASGEKHAQQ